MPSQPYMYNPPQRYSATSDSLYGFDPKAATKASRVPPRSPPKQQDGPLVDLNRHPDNYLVLPQGRGTAKPMNPKVKVAIKWTRWVQLGLRILQLIGAIGLLICVICIKGTQITEGWIIRVPAAVDIVCELYAIYHLVRPAKSRAPSSSASYHFFALVIDTGLIPFYVFTALLANSNWQEAPGTDGRWRTFFKTEDATYKVLLSSWLSSVTVGGLHLISIGLGLYLVLVFRMISKMPPDMNPLEDNLTSRGSMRRHKYKTSSLSGIPQPSEKRWSEMTENTAVPSPSRSSHARDDQPLIPDARTMPFMHSRRGSDVTYNPHNPRSARESRVFEAYRQQPQSNTASRVGGSNISPPKLDLTNLPVKISPGSAGGYDSMSPASSPGGRSPARSKRESLRNDNWFVHPEPEGDSGSDYGDDDDEQTTARVPLVQQQRRYSFEAGQDDEGAVAAMYKDIVTAQPHGPLSPLSDGENTGHLRPEPLRMNPPSPQPPAPLNPTPPKKNTNTNANPARPAPPPPMPSFMSEIGSVSSDRSATTIGRALTINSTVTRNTDNWSYFPSVQHARHTYNGGPIEPPPMSDAAHTSFSPPSRTPTGSGRKARYYGDLKDAQDSILGARNSNRNKKGRASPPPPPPSQPQQPQQQKALPKMYPQLSPSPARSPGISPGLGLLPPQAGGGTTHRAMGRSPQRPAYARMETSPRVVSRSGVDVELVGAEDEAVDLGVSGNKGRRVVSGRAAEEGLAGFGVVRRKVSGMA